ncbi:RNA methyltransferase [Plasmodium gonderi]|uniref:RNA methyltransferase n=1 Tax=Plasmodium gonderi TaxID=77519 RepID=A0A1Y1JFJ5_PLAGO|nr:RNA methyltransferase [Plasmodium gonderi]GAW81301.1 RNA methyltransferase [Plasmodium gonderi]
MFFFANVIKKHMIKKCFLSESFFILAQNIGYLRNDNNIKRFHHHNHQQRWYSVVNTCSSDGSSEGEHLKPHWISLNGKEKSKINKRIKGTQVNVVGRENDREYLSISKKSKMMKYIIRLRKKRNFRKKMNSFFVKDSKTIMNLANNNDLIFEAVLSNQKNLLQHFKNKCPKLYYVNNDMINYIFHDSLKVNKITCNDAVAILKIPNSVQKKERIKFLLALDRIRYAYNLGKILNTAYSMNIDCLFYIHNTVDPFNHKVIEITNGSHFHIPYIFGSYTELRQFCETHNVLPIVAHTRGVSPIHILKTSTQQEEGICLILGNESTGPHADILSFAKPISLPMHEMTNSLNVSVAASILIHYLKSML